MLYDYVATEKNALSLRAGELATLIEACLPRFIFCLWYSDFLPPCIQFKSYLLRHSRICLLQVGPILCLQNYEHGWCTVRMILTGKEGYFPGKFHLCTSPDFTYSIFPLSLIHPASLILKLVARAGSVVPRGHRSSSGGTSGIGNGGRWCRWKPFAGAHLLNTIFE